jgi:adenine phosphoribosyltransferase
VRRVTDRTPQERDPQLRYLEQKLRSVPDFPIKGIVFKDITPALADPRGLAIMVDGFAQRFVGQRIDAVVGIEARGFIFGGALAHRLGAGFVLARKSGKLPAAVDRVSYETEYSKDTLEMHQGSWLAGARVIVVDDVLATGGTAAATASLVEKQGGELLGFAFVIELAFLGGRAKLAANGNERRVESLLIY